MKLRSALRIRAGEERVAFRLLALMAVAMAGAAIGANGVESLFFARFGPEFLPYLYVGLGPLTFAVMAGMGTVLSGQAVRFLVRLPLVLAVTMLAARGVLTLELRWFYPAMWLVMMVVWTCQVMGSWGLAGAVSDTRQAKRLFPLYGAGLIAGGVVGGLATGPIAGLIHAENLLFVWAAALVAAHLLARGLPGGAPVRRRRAGRPRIVRQLGEGLRDVWTWPLLRWMSVSLVLFAVLYFTLVLLFAEGATARYPRADELAGFLGLFMGASNGAALLVSLLLANRLFARFGLPTMVMALAVIYVAGFAALSVTSAFGALLAFRFVQMVWVNGVWATGWQALFNVVPAERRARTRTFMDAGPLQLGIVLAGALLILADVALAPAQLTVVGAVAGILALIAMWRARRAYSGALVEALRAGNPDVFRPDEEPFGGFRDDADANVALLAGVADPDPAVRRVSTGILAGLAGPEAASALAPALADDDPHVRAAAVRGLARTGRDPERLRGLLEDPDPEVRAGAAGALAGEPGSERTMAEMERDPRPEWRAEAVAARGRAGRGAEAVAAALGDPEPEVRRAAAASLASFPPEVAVGALIQALGDPDEAVRRHVVTSLSRIGPPAEPALIASLDDPVTRPGAIRALAAVDAPPPPALSAFARDRAGLAARYHRHWLGIAPGADDRLDLLARGLRHRALAHGLEALLAVGRSGDPKAMAVAIENLSSPDAGQRANALETVEAVGEPEVIRATLPVWDATLPTGGNEARTVAELLRDEDPWLRACAALAAAAIDGPDLRPVLDELARDDRDELVRQAATVPLDDVETLSTLSLLERVLFLTKVRLFAELPPEDLKHVAEVTSEHTFPDGEVIAEQGEPGEEMHVVVSGEIRVMVGHDGESPVEVARRARGEYVGEMAILGGESRMASLVCAGSVRTLSLDRPSFQRILRERPDVSLAVMRVLSERLRQAYGDAAG
jgi:HEAT repeat protein